VKRPAIGVRRDSSNGETRRYVDHLSSEIESLRTTVTISRQKKGSERVVKRNAQVEGGDLAIQKRGNTPVQFREFMERESVDQLERGQKGPHARQ